MTDRLARRLALAVLAGGIALRFVQLGADPYYYEWNGYITDEGRWIAHARALWLFGGIGSVGTTLHLLLAPLFQAAELLVFSLAGVSLASARVISVLSGSALLIGFWAVYRRLAGPAPLLLALAMLAVETDMVVLSRLAVPEMAAMALSFAAFALAAGARGGRRLAAAGLVTAAAIAAKATVLPFAPILGLIVVQRRPEAGPSGWRALGWFGAGLSIPAALGLVGLGAAGAVGAVPLGFTFRVLRDFVGLTDLYALVAFPFDDTLAPTIAIWGLASWLGCLGALTGAGEDEPPAARVHLHGAALWVGCFAPLMLALDYFPSRYKVHLLIPLAVIVALGGTRLHRGGLAGLHAALARLRGARRAGAALLLAVPTALIAAATLLSLSHAVGWDPERVRIRHGAIALALVVVGLVARRGLARLGLVRGLVWFPVLWTAGWLVAERLSLVTPRFWPVADGSSQALRWGLSLGAAAAALAAAGLGGRPARAARACFVAGALLYAGLGLVRLAPGYLEPHYSMRETSRDLGVLLDGVRGPIGTLGGEALFNENRLPYRSVMNRRLPKTPLEVVVLAGVIEDPEDRLDRGYRLVRQYALFVAPELVLGDASWKASHGPFLRTNVRVYRRADGG
jgi:hypothetical protein